MDIRWQPVVLLSGAALVLSGCAAGGDAQQSRTDEPVIMTIGSDIGTLDPHLGTSNDLTQFKNFIYDRLLYIDEESNLAPWLATEWSSTARTIDLIIRDDVQCSDGSTITPGVVAANFERILAEDSSSPLRGGEMPVDMVVTADDAAGTVHFETQTDFPFLLERVSATNIVCQGGLDDTDALASESFGSGPYVLEGVEAGVEYRLVRNDDYNSAPGGVDAENDKRPEKVNLRIVGNETTAANLLLSGEANISSIQGPDRDRVEKAGVDSQTYRVTLGELFFNQDEGRVAADLEMRQAIIEALKLEDLGKVVTSNRGEPATSLVTLDPTTCPVDSVSGNLPEFDAEAAGQRLDALGWKAGSDGMRSKEGVPLLLKVIYPTKFGQPLANAVEMLGTQLNAVGIAVDLHGLDSPGMSGIIWDSGDFDIAWNIFTNTSPAPFAGILSGANPRNGGSNFGSVANAEYNDLVQRATVAEGDEVCELWNEAEVSLVRNLDAVPFYQGNVPFFFENVTGELWRGSVAGWSLRMP